jgi:hypothetical protein
MLKRANFLFILFIIIILSSCVEHKISIIVYPEGSFDYDHSASGDKKDLLDFDFSLPTGLDWVINHNLNENSDDYYFNAIKIFEEGEKFPHSFYTSDSISNDILLNHDFSIEYSNTFIRENWDINIIYSGRNASQKYPLVAQFLKDQDNPPNGWVFNGLEYIFNQALSETDIGFNLEPMVKLDLQNWLNKVNQDYNNESLQEDFEFIKNEGVLIVCKNLLENASTQFSDLVKKYENEARITIDLADDIIELTTIIPGILVNSNADSTFGDTLLWRFSGIDILDDDFVISAQSTIYYNDRFQWIGVLTLLFIAFITLYLIARKVPDPMKMSK